MASKIDQLIEDYTAKIAQAIRDHDDENDVQEIVIRSSKGCVTMDIKRRSDRVLPDWNC